MEVINKPLIMSLVAAKPGITARELSIAYGYKKAIETFKKHLSNMVKENMLEVVKHVNYGKGVTNGYKLGTTKLNFKLKQFPPFGSKEELTTQIDIITEDTEVTKLKEQIKELEKDVEILRKVNMDLSLSNIELNTENQEVKVKLQEAKDVTDETNAIAQTGEEKGKYVLTDATTLLFDDLGKAQKYAYMHCNKALHIAKIVQEVKVKLEFIDI